MSKDNGGPAFPVSGMQHDGGFHGVTLRDYFAAKAMQGELASQSPEVFMLNHNVTDEQLDAFCKHCFRIGSAMLAARGES